MKLSILLLTLLLAYSAAYAQRPYQPSKHRSNQTRLNQNRLLRMRDSLDRVLIVNTRATATLINKRQIELYTFNQFSGQTYYYDRNGDDANFSGKDLRFDSFFQVGFGVSRRRRLNVGLEANYSSGRHDTENNKSIFTTFDGSPHTFNAFTYGGVRLKVQPFAKLNSLLYQTYVWLPLVNTDMQVSLGLRKWYWGHSIYYYKFFKQKIGFTVQANFAFAQDKYDTEQKKSEDIDFNTSFGGNLSFVLARKNVIYIPLLYARMNENVEQVFEGADSDEFQYGIGYQRIFSRRFFVVVNYSRTLFAHNYGKWEHVGIGVRYVL